MTKFTKNQSYVLKTAAKCVVIYVATGLVINALGKTMND